jgi:hypothetical protein
MWFSGRQHAKGPGFNLPQHYKKQNSNKKITSTKFENHSLLIAKGLKNGELQKTNSGF